MYNFKEIEEKWKKYWEENETFKTDVWDFSKPKYYALDMFPYPSGEGLHIGHIEGYTATDIMARFKRMRGYNVLHPIGFDSFGLQAEHFAVKTGHHPAVFTYQNIRNFENQLKNAGLSFDWSREVITCEPEYYKWTQWIFKQMYKDGLAKYCDMPVNWCEELGTVLSNDEVIDGKSERGGYPVVRKNMKQWTLDIVKYADKLLDGHKYIDWPTSTIEMQKNWIGRSDGADVKFKVADSEYEFSVFTTRVDTLFGATYCALAPEHKLVSLITTEQQKDVVNEYVDDCARKSELERTQLSVEKTGVWTGAYAINPANNKKIPIYIADYVLMYGTGAVMAVPAHDERDYAFAKKYNLPMIEVVKSEKGIKNEAYIEDGEHFNSEFLNGLNIQQSKEKMYEWLETNNLGNKKINYRLRDWIFGRQRYWGEPIPVVHMEDGSIQLVDDKDLPLILPELEDYKPCKDGNSPLDRAESWKNVVINGKNGKRETTTMPSATASSWYFLRYIDPHNGGEFADRKLLDHWLPVDLYLGGPEHAVGHLLYSRFWNRFLYDKGYLSNPEPFKKLIHQGMILGSNGEKMSKSKGNVVNPNDFIAENGADVLRLYEMFMGPLQDSKPWNTQGIEGVKRFLEKVWNIYYSDKIQENDDKTLEKVYHQTVKKVTQDYENMSFNTAISQMMIFINAVQKTNVLPMEYAKGFIKLLNPIAPFITEEIWNTIFGNKESIAYEEWPTYDESKVKEDNYDMVIQVNGKVRDKQTIALGTDVEEMKEIALNAQKIKDFIGEKEVIKVIPIKDKLVNIVIKG